jgi:hypothetical protein
MGAISGQTAPRPKCGLPAWASCFLWFPPGTRRAGLDRRANAAAAAAAAEAGTPPTV